MVPKDIVSCPINRNISLPRMFIDVYITLELTIGFFTKLGIGRTLIPRYFRSIFEGGVTDLRYDLRHPKESFHNTTITLDCDQCTVVTLHGKPMFTKV